ncbi:MAG: hypothetical protein QW404_00655 [Candidatus Nanoarchaeia archaeon]
MDIEVYFSDLKKKYGVTEALSNLIDRQKEEYLRFYSDYTNEDGANRTLKSIESRIKVEYEIHMIHEDPKFKPLFELVREDMKKIKEGKVSEKTNGLKPVLEDLAKAFRDFKRQLDSINLDFSKKKKK